MQEAEVMTQDEAVIVAALYRRERDDVTEQLGLASIWCAVLADMSNRDAVKRVMNRPGIQNGLKGIEEMEAKGVKTD